MKAYLRLITLISCISIGLFADEIAQSGTQSNTQGESQEVSEMDYQKAKAIIKKRKDAVNTNSADEKSGFLLGINIGGGLPYSQTDADGDISSFIASVGIIGGYQKFFSPYSGMRFYADLHAGSGFSSRNAADASENLKQKLTMLALNIDALVGMGIGEDKTKSIGLVGGLGFAAALYDDNFSGLDGVNSGFVINGGVFLSSGKHRFELLAKILPLNYIKANTDDSSVSFTNVLGSFGYSYVF